MMPIQDKQGLQYPTLAALPSPSNAISPIRKEKGKVPGVMDVGIQDPDFYGSRLCL